MVKQFKKNYFSSSEVATGRSEVPYHNLQALGVQIYGMPPHITFHSPLLYNQQELQQILANLEKIVFLKVGSPVCFCCCCTFCCWLANGSTVSTYMLSSHWLLPNAPLTMHGHPGKGVSHCCPQFLKYIDKCGPSKCLDFVHMLKDKEFYFETSRQLHLIDLF